MKKINNAVSLFLTIIALACWGVSFPASADITTQISVLPNTNSANTYVQLSITGLNVRWPFTIEATTNVALGQWSPVTNLLVLGAYDNSVQIGFTEDILIPMRFYRVVQPIVNTGAVISITNLPNVPSQNINVDAQHQPLGSFNITVANEPVDVQSMTFYFVALSGSLGETINVITLNEANTGTVVAGPYDSIPVDPDGNIQKVTFSTTASFAVGTHTYILRGEISSDKAVAGTIIEAFTDPATDWQYAAGDITGNPVSLANIRPFSMDDMTVTIAH